MSGSTYLPKPPRVWMNSRPELAGKPYRPPNGTEGRNFADWFCDGCRRDHAAHMGDLENGCEIYACSIAFNPGDEHYPSEWIIADDGFPACTAFDPDGCS